jgi:hypothetical protein
VLAAAVTVVVAKMAASMLGAVRELLKRWWGGDTLIYT